MHVPWLTRHARTQERGAVAVEFALVLIPLLVLILGSMQFGWYFFTSQSASSAARETTRRLTVGDCQDPGDAQTYAEQQAGVNGLTLTYGEAVAGSDTALAAGSEGVLPAQGDQLRVVVTADGNIIGFLPMPSGGQVTRVTDSRVEDTTEESC